MKRYICTTGLFPKGLNPNFTKINNASFLRINRPIGGLWGSSIIRDKISFNYRYYNNYKDTTAKPSRSITLYTTDWMKYLKHNDEEGKVSNSGIIYGLKDNAKIYYIYSIEDYKNLLLNYSYKLEDWLYVDWELLSKDFDGFYISKEMVNELKYVYVEEHESEIKLGNFNKWDVETWLLFNSNPVDYNLIYKFNSNEEFNSYCRELFESSIYK